MRKINRIGVLTLSLMMVLSIIPIAFNGDSGTPFQVFADTEGDYEYTLTYTGDYWDTNSWDEGAIYGATITRYTGTGNSIIIPDSLGGYPVLSIGEGSFNGCTSLTEVTIPDSVIEIRGNLHNPYHTYFDSNLDAFRNCSSLKNVYIGSGVKRIAPTAFGDCSSIENYTVNADNPVYFSKNGALFHDNEYFFDEADGDDNIHRVTLVEYPSGDNSISYSIPDKTTGIGGHAFSGSNNLINIEFPDSINSIGEYAFYNCSSLVSIEFPDSIKGIGAYAFYNCSSLKSIKFPSMHQRIYEGTFSGCTSLISIAIPQGFKGIESYAFSGCTSLTEISIPSSVEIIFRNTFSDCLLLRKATILNENVDFYPQSFNNCPLLTIYGYEYSTAHSYATQYGFPFVVLDNDPVYNVSVINGKGSGSYEVGSTVTVTANSAPLGKVFSIWTSADVFFANTQNSTTTFKMPNKDVTVTANYKNSQNNIQTPDDVVKKQLPQPSGLKLTKKKATWNTVKNNSGYTLKIKQGSKTIFTKQIKKNTKGYTFTKSDKKKFKKGKKYTFTLVAKGTGNYKNSPTAKSKSVVLKKK